MQSLSTLFIGGKELVIVLLLLQLIFRKIFLDEEGHNLYCYDFSFKPLNFHVSGRALLSLMRHYLRLTPRRKLYLLILNLWISKQMYFERYILIYTGFISNILRVYIDLHSLCMCSFFFPEHIYP